MPTPNLSPTSTLKSLNVGVYFHYFFDTYVDPYFNDFVSPDGPQNDTRKGVFFETSDLAKV